jgi:hypothetical protein
MSSRQDETATIILAGEARRIEAFTLDELQQVLPALESVARAAAIGERIKAARAVLAAALGESEETLGARKISLAELLDAVDAIAKVSGLEALKNRAAAAQAAAN